MLSFRQVCKRVSLVAAMTGLLSLAAAAQTSNTQQTTPHHRDNSTATTSSSSAKTSTQSSTAPNVIDQKFVKSAASGNMAEIDLAKMADQKATSPEVKKFAERMEKDHTKANEQLQQIAAKAGMTLPEKAGVMDRKTETRLSKLSGDKFDQEYMSTMVKDHKKDVSAFQREARIGQNPQIKNFATKTLPTLQEHLKQAENIAPKTQTTAQNTSR